MSAFTLDFWDQISWKIYIPLSLREEKTLVILIPISRALMQSFKQIDSNGDFLG